MFIDFLKTHYELIISCLFLLISFILALFRKKSKFNLMDEIKSFILSVLPEIINSVETDGNGETKLLLVLKEIQLLLVKKYNFYDFDSIQNFVIESIENILSTPKKKED